MTRESKAEQRNALGGSRLRGAALISVVAALMLTLFLEALDQIVVGTALPKMVASFHGFDRYSWIVTAYLLASTTMIPIVGKFSDQFGRKKFLITGVVIFLIGSTLCGLAQSMNQLIIFRGIQGLGAGIGVALVFTVIGDIFSPVERARWQGIFSGVYGLASVVGPALGGWLTDHGPLLGNLVLETTRWRWIFYLNLPVGIIALAALLIFLPANISGRSASITNWAAMRRIDFLGALVASGATICLLLGLTWGSDQSYDWISPQVIGVLAASIILYISFFIIECFAAEPLLPPGLFRIQTFSADAALTFFMGMILFPIVVYSPLFLQGVLGASPTSSGLILTPLSVSIVTGTVIAGFLISRLGRYQFQVLVAMIILFGGVFLLGQMDTNTSYLFASLFMIPTGIGVGLALPVQTIAAQNAVARERIGTGTGVITYLRALGQTLGVAIVGAVVSPSTTALVATPTVGKTLQYLSPTVWHQGLFVILCLCLCALIAGFFLKDLPLRKS